MPPIPLPSALAGDATPPHAAGEERALLRPLTSALHLWHLLSLDAPTVATLWTALIVRAASVSLPTATLPAMFLAVWLLYTVDRLLDTRHLRPRSALQPEGLSRHNPPGLEARHLFHHRHRRGLALGLGAAFLLLAALLPQLSPAAIELDLLLGSLVLGYFALIHLSHPSRRLPKEIAVGVFFAAAVFIPSVARRPELRPALAPLALLFALLCSLNCIAIYAWEHPSAAAADAPHPLTRLGTVHLRPALWVLLLGSLVVAFASAFHVLALAMALAAALLLLLDRFRHSLAPTTVRALADLALTTPLLFLLRR